MIDKIVSLIAPHLCCNCRKIGAILCPSCFKNISEASFAYCVVCLKKCETSICYECQNRHGILQAWIVGRRETTLKKLIDLYKFERTKSASHIIANLLHEASPPFPRYSVIVPIPTTNSHIRQRGYDHVSLVAKHFARKRKVPYAPLLRRRSSSVQHTSSRKDRAIQAAQAFECSQQLDHTVHYIVIDDIMTTGATMTEAAKCLLSAGATEVSIAVVARQMLDESKQI